MKQLSLFDNSEAQDNSQPVPIIIANRWNFPLAYHIIEDEYYYAIQDWIAGLVSCDIPKAANLWQKMISETVISIHGLDYIATDGKTYQRPHTTDKGLYDIAAHMRATKSRPVLIEAKDYLAKAGVLVDRQRLDPELAATHYLQSKYDGKPEAWIEARVQGIVARNALTDAIKDTVIDIVQGKTYSLATETINLHLLERTTKRLRQDLNITPKQNPRDYMGQYALIYLRLTESIIASKLGDNEYVTEIQMIEIIRLIATMIHEQYLATQTILGYDLVTERKFLA